MPIYSAFSIPSLGMRAQSYSMSTIGNNIANVNTGGFKRTDTNFSTLLGNTLDKQSDIGGVRPKDLNQISKQGRTEISNRDLDLAINGKGFFIMNTSVTGSGSTFYGRDGSFEMATINDISVTGNGGSTITVKDGYLVDKNGYFLQGWAPDSASGLFTSTSLSSLRVDPYAFATNGQTTTSAILDLNLPAGDSPGTSHVTEIALTGTLGVAETGDIYSVTVEGTTASYTVTGSETSLNEIRTGLIAAINANPAISAQASASASPTDGKLLITGNDQGTSLTITGSAINAGAADDSVAKESTVQQAKAGDTQYYNIEVFDSNGNARSARLDFVKTGINTWDLSTTVGKAPVAQVDTLTLGGTVEAGDVYSIVVAGTAFSKTVGATDTLDTIRDALVTSINTSTTIKVTAAAGGPNVLTLTADTSGTAFTSTASTTNRTPTAQVDNVTLSGSYAAGDTVSVQIDGLAPVVYTVTSNDLTVDGIGGAAVAGNSATAYNNITTKLTAAIVADAPSAALTTATATGAGSGVITLTATTAGSAFTQASSATATATGVSTASTATANVAAAVAQIDNATLTGVYAPGDTISVNIDAIGAVLYTVVANDLTLDGVGGGGPVAGGSTAAYDNITAKIAAGIIADGPTAAVVTAAASGGGSGVVTLTAVTAGTSFAQVTSATGAGAATGSTPTANVVGPIAQVDNATLTSTYAAGDIVSLNINGIGAVTYTVVPNDLTANGDGTGGVVAGNSAAAYNNITTNIAAAVNANAPTAAVITAAAVGGGGGVVSLTADAPGTAFTQVTSSSRGAVSTATPTTPTANVSALADNTLAVVNTTANVSASESTTTAVTTLTFDANGQLLNPTSGSVTLALTFPPVGTIPAGTASVDIDISKLSQFAGTFQPNSYSNNGYAAATAQSFSFDSKGQVIAKFDDGTNRVIYKIPLAQFSNANALQEYNGNVFQETEASGSANVVDAVATGYASFLPNTHELSNVDLAGEFSRMIMTQTAYNSSSTVFKTIDEMVIAARDLKR